MTWVIREKGDTTSFSFLEKGKIITRIWCSNTGKPFAVYVSNIGTASKTGYSGVFIKSGFQEKAKKIPEIGWIAENSEMLGFINFANRIRNSLKSLGLWGEWQSLKQEDVGLWVR